MRLTDAADRAIREGAIVTARKFLDEAVKRVEATQRRGRRCRGPGQAEAASPTPRSMRGAPMPPRSPSTIKAAADDYAKAFELVEKWDDKLKWNYKNFEAEALNAHGAATGDRRRSEARDRGLSRRSSTSFPAARRTRDWAITRNNMAVVLQTLGERESGTQSLTEAAADLPRIRWRSSSARRTISTGPRRRTISATCSWRSASARADRSSWKRRSRRSGRRSKSATAPRCRSTGRRPRTTSASRFIRCREREAGERASDRGRGRLPRRARGIHARQGAGANGRWCRTISATR